MSRKLFAAVALFSVTAITAGCRQTTAPMNSPLTPVGSYSGLDQLQPVQPTSGIGPLGGSTRVPPPPTGGYSVPNNYMGGVAPYGQTSSTQPIGNGFASNVAPVTAAGGWVQSGQLSTGSVAANNSPTFGGSFQTGQPTAAAPPHGNPVQAIAGRPQSGGMRVIDLTGAPNPPGYQQPYPSIPSGVGFGGSFAPSNAGNSGVAPASFLPGFGPNNGAPVANAGPQAGQPAHSIAQAAPTGVQTREFPMRSSPTEPSWNGTSQFPAANQPSRAPQPSTDPVDTSLIPTDAGLSWRRPY